MSSAKWQSRDTWWYEKRQMAPLSFSLVYVAIGRMLYKTQSRGQYVTVYYLRPRIYGISLHVAYVYGRWHLAAKGHALLRNLHFDPYFWLPGSKPPPNGKPHLKILVN